MSMAGYTKLFSSILASSVWCSNKETKILWITLLAMAGKDGIAETSTPGLARAAGLTIEETERGLVELRSPDPFSRTKEHEGRRIEPVDGGWVLLNHAKYREKMSIDERRKYKREKQKEYRKRDAKKPKKSTHSTSGQSGHIAEADTKASTEREQAPSNQPREGKLLDEIPCPQCEVAGALIQQPPRGDYPAQFWCKPALGGCNFSMTFDAAGEVISKMTPGARRAIEKARGPVAPPRRHQTADEIAAQILREQK